MYNVTEASEMTGLRRNKLLQYIREGKIEPTVFSLTGRHLFDDDGVKSIKKFLEEESKVIRSTEVASILGVTVATLLKYIKRGLIKPIKVVNEINYFDKEEVERLSLSFGSVDFDNLIQAGEASEILGITVTRMNQLVAQNRLIPDRILPGGKHFYLRENIEKVAELAKQLYEANESKTE
ncbi:MAG: helix-turn-helix domain-containing protein [Bacilli bacterium]|nr:helix-turn-helix domain-containing protein [Bacilli bacterium]